MASHPPLSPDAQARINAFMASPQAQQYTKLFGSVGPGPFIQAAVNYGVITPDEAASQGFNVQPDGTVNDTNQSGLSKDVAAVGNKVGPVAAGVAGGLITGGLIGGAAGGAASQTGGDSGSATGYASAEDDPNDFTTTPDLSSSGGNSLIGGSAASKLASNSADLSKMFGSFANSQANNRNTTGNFTQRYDQQALADQQGRNANESDALKKLYQTSYIQGGGSTFKPGSSITLNGQSRTIPTYGLSLPPISDAQKTGAGTLQAQLLSRLAPGGSVTPSPLSSYTQPGTAENIGNYGQLITSSLGLAKNIFG